MITPKEIYLAVNDEVNNIQYGYSSKPFEASGGYYPVKYIRADLTELTPDDMKLIHEISEDVWEPNWNAEEEMNGYKEVLRRFNETKNK